MESQVFQNWGRLFTIEFDIIVTGYVPGWTNVFHFTAEGNYDNYGDRIPALYIDNINNQGYFHICSAINGNPNYKFKIFRDVSTTTFGGFLFMTISMVSNSRLL